MSTELIKNAELLTDAIAALAECDQEYRADYLLSARPEIVSTLRALLAALAGDGWQPIEAAPKDGRYILAIVAENDSRHMAHQVGRMFCIRFDSYGDKFGGWAVYPGYGGSPDSDFSHWMPLPEPPK